MIISAGQRVALVDIFRRTAKDIGVDTKVYTSDMELQMVSSHSGLAVTF